MKKIETIWRHLLYESLEKKKRNKRYTQKELAKKFHVSLSTVFHALAAPRALSAIEVTGRDFRVRDGEKLLYLWATHRNLKKDMLYQTHVDAATQTIEGTMPPNVIFGAFSAYRLKYGEAPADYAHVYVYAETPDAIKKRFPIKKGYPNLFVLKKDPHLADFGPLTPDVQIFADLWNISEWYAKDFIEALREKLL